MKKSHKTETRKRRSKYLRRHVKMTYRVTTIVTLRFNS